MKPTSPDPHVIPHSPATPTNTNTSPEKPDQEQNRTKTNNYHTQLQTVAAKKPQGPLGRRKILWQNLKERWNRKRMGSAMKVKYEILLAFVPTSEGKLITKEVQHPITDGTEKGWKN